MKAKEQIMEWIKNSGSSGGSAGGIPMEHVAIKVVLLLKHSSRAALPVAVDAFVDTGCSFPMMCSDTTWHHIQAHFPDCIEPCDHDVALASGVMRVTERAGLKVILRFSDNECSAMMSVYRSDKDLLGLIGLESLGLLVDAPRKCLIRAKMLYGCHFAFNPNSAGSQVEREGPPPQRTDSQGHVLVVQETVMSQKLKCG
jgi:hypothetical protein